MKPSVSELTRQLQQYDRNSENPVSQQFIRNAAAFTDEQVKYESEALRNDRRCKSDGSAFIPVLDGLNQDKISEQLKTNFMDVALLEAFRCILDKILDTTDESGQTLRMAIEEYMNGLKTFGTESANGFAMRGGMIANRPKASKRNAVAPKNGRPPKPMGYLSVNPQDYHRIDINDTLVMKCPRAPSKSNEMAHEVVIGLEGLNAIRDIIPNFSYVFGAPELGPPVFNDKKESIGWANQDKYRVRYAIYENIDKAKPMGSLERPEELILYYLQAVCALKIANEICDFTHYDAHDENVLIRDVSQAPFYITYLIDNQDVYVRSLGSIATFIDYGMSHIVTRDGRPIGILDKNGGFRQMGIRPDESNVISDTYKLICMLLMRNYERLKRTNSREDEAMVFMCLKVLAYFFNVRSYTDITPDDIVSIIYGQWNMRFHIPLELTGKFTGNTFTPYWSMDGLIAHCVGIANEINPANVVYDKPSNVLDREMVFPSNKAVVKELREISDMSVPVPDAYELFKANGTNELNRLVAALQKNPELSVKREEANCAELLAYDYQDSFHSLDHSSSSEITNYLKTFTTSIKAAYGLIDVLIRLKDKIKEVTFCTQITPVFNDLLDRLRAANAKLTKSLAKIRNHIIMGEQHLKILIFGTGAVVDSVGVKNKLYPLWDAYRSTVASLSSLN
jgi:hypothetical protein